MLLGIFLNQSQKKKKKGHLMCTQWGIAHIWACSYLPGTDWFPERKTHKTESLIGIFLQIIRVWFASDIKFLHTGNYPLLSLSTISWTREGWSSACHCSTLGSWTEVAVLPFPSCATLPQLRQQVQQVWGISKATADYCRTLAWKKWVSADNFKPSDCSSAWGLCCPRLWTG